MTGKLCFWAILSTSDLKFIYISPSLAKLLGIPPNVVPETMQGRTLWDLIHPDEYAMARGDLEKFMETKHIGGSVTRCRLVDLDDIIEPKFVRRSSSEVDIPVKIQPRPLDRKKSVTGGPNWEVVDIVMYLVTNEIILTFFHADYDLDQPNGAGSLPLICQEIDFTPQDGIDLLSILQNTPLAAARASFSGNARIFQIMETDTSKALVTWPPATDPSRISLQLSDVSLSQLLIDCVERNKHRTVDRLKMHPYEYATCVQQAQVYTQLLYESGPVKKVEVIVIQYGSITFGSFDISRLDQSTPLLTASTDSTNLSLLPRSGVSSSPTSITNDSHNFITLNSIGSNIGSRETHSNEQSPDDQDIASTDGSAGPPSVWNTSISVSGTSSVSNTSRVVCESCHTHSSPEWRKGPSGQKNFV
ncbi:hypothetical protein BC943DRAFT_330756 [Umbelopsis sp. AD052]|nr:hypothetical protein BC943DRAFT_330756 [Umbelopsis sp. AD052]